jgi:hypothetical protein
MEYHCLHEILLRQLIPFHIHKNLPLRLPTRLQTCCACVSVHIQNLPTAEVFRSDVQSAQLAGRCYRLRYKWVHCTRSTCTTKAAEPE